MNNLKIKIVTGFRDDQSFSISSEEAHKAYFLFLNPDQRGVFENGLAIRGSDIQRIEPDYQGTMGWNSTHRLDEDDWNEIKEKGIDRKLQDLLSQARRVARLENPQIKLPFSEAIKSLPENKVMSDEVKQLADKISLLTK